MEGSVRILFQETRKKPTDREKRVLSKSHRKERPGIIIIIMT